MRYFIEVSYLGYAYSGSQTQINGITVQALIEKALSIFLSEKITLSGASRTDAGVHAKQNFFQFDTQKNIPQKALYNLNALLPFDIAIKNIIHVNNHAHCRFDAEQRTYEYIITQTKNPFLFNRAYYYPYNISIELLAKTAKYILLHNQFHAFCKKHVQVKSFECVIFKSQWQYLEKEKILLYQVSANRFLRGMVKALVSTQLEVARGNMDIQKFENLLTHPELTQALFTAPSHGLYLIETRYPQSIFY